MIEGGAKGAPVGSVSLASEQGPQAKPTGRWTAGAVMIALTIMGLSLLAALMIGTVATAMASAADHGAASWGANEYGQLGDGTDNGPHACESEHFCSATPVPVNGLGQVTAVSAGGNHSLALLSNGKVMAWGSNEFGQLGDGTTTGPETCGEPGSSQHPCSTTPVAVNGLQHVEAISAGADYSLALLSNGKVMAWGRNQSGQLGDGTTANSDVPVAASGLSAHVSGAGRRGREDRVTAVSAGGDHSLARLSNGTVMAWGSNEYGQLGDGTTTGPETCGELGSPQHHCSTTPVAVSGLSGVSAIAGGADISTALVNNGTVMTWGAGLPKYPDEELGNSDVPVPVSGLSGVTAIAASAGANFRLALLSNGTVMAWGTNGKGQLGFYPGDGECGPFFSAPCSRTPVAVSGVSGVAAIAAGGENSLALLKNGTVMAWGAADSGDLGNGIYSWPIDYHFGEFESTPVGVCGLSDVRGISAGGGETYAPSRYSISSFSLAFGNEPGPPCKPPEALSVQPSYGPLAGGTSVTITGDNFDGATAVRFGATSATSFTVNSDTSITAVSPPAGTEANKSVTVTVTTPEGTSRPLVGYQQKQNGFYYETTDLKSVACPSSSQCTAVDQFGREVTFNPISPGTPTSTTIDSGYPNEFHGFNSVACPSSTQCTAVDDIGQEVTFNPTSPGTPTPTTIDGGYVLASVACPSSTQCTAVDYQGHEVTFNPTSPGTPTPTRIGGGSPSEFQSESVACPSSTQCTAVGEKGYPGEGAQEATFNPISPGTPTPTTVDRAYSFQIPSVACPSESQCTAVDSPGREVTFNPTLPGTPTPTSIGGEFYSESVACPSSTQCTAVAYQGREVTFNPASPGTPTPTPIDGNYHNEYHGVNSVACPSSTQCTAVDSEGREITFNPTSPGIPTPTPTSIEPSSGPRTAAPR
jgi:alpha-tubulin suppressor-like RCC1 family protein